MTQPAFWKGAMIGLGGIVLPIVPSCYIHDTAAAVFGGRPTSGPLLRPATLTGDAL